MAAYGAGDQVAAAVPTGGVAGWGAYNLPNFVGELFRLSPIDTPLLSLIGGLTGGMRKDAPVFTWQDTLHRAPAVQSNVDGDDATFSNQKRNERSNVTMIHQYGVELDYTKQSSPGLLGTSGASPATGATTVLGSQPVQNEMSWQLQIKLEQAALDVEKVFLDGTLAYPNDGTARQTQGIRGAIAAATSTDYTATTGQLATAAVINDIAKKMWDDGAKHRNTVIMVNSTPKQEIGNDYSGTANFSLEPRSRSVFGVNVTDLETEFGMFPIVLNRHTSQDEVLFLDLAYLAPCFLPHPTKGNFFLEPLAKSGAYDRMQLYGEIGLEYGPANWHGKAHNLHA
jgi:hypothetical protein